MALVDEIESGNSLLFLGAGFSLQATNALNQPMKSAYSLLLYLLQECGIDDPEGYDLESAAEEYIEKHGEVRLISLLHDNFMTTAVSADQRTIICQPWHRIYTTNYDNAVERACLESSKAIVTKTVSDRVEPPPEGVSQLIHIYGSAARLSPEEFRSHFLLTEAQLDNSPFFSSPWFTRFSDDVLSVKHVLFVGFSLRDLDIRRLLRWLPPSTKGKIRFIDRPNCPVAAERRFSKFGSVSKIGLEGLAKELITIRPGKARKTNTDIPRFVKEFNFSLLGKQHISSTDLTYLIVAGVIDDTKFSNQDLIGERGSYTFKRSANHYARVANARAGQKPVLVHSDIGNGKSTFITQLAYHFTQEGRKVFQVIREAENSGEVIAFLQNTGGPTVVIFDDLMSFTTLVKSVLGIGRSDLLVIVTVRSPLLDTAKHIIRSRIGTEVHMEIDLNLSSAEEVKGIVRYLDENGLFGELAELSISDRERYISRNCNGQVRDIILSLFQAGSLHQRVTSVLNGLVDLDPKFQEIAIFGAILTISDLRRFGQLPLVAELLNFNSSFEELRSAFAERQILGLIQLENSDIFFRSSALALFALKNVFDLRSVLRVAKTALFALDVAFYDDREFDRLSRALLKFSTYNRMLKTKQDEIDIERFYDECRVLKLALSDPSFLVQRSINSMHYGRFDVSKQFVETAYAKARGKVGFDPYQIDTHYANLLLTESSKVRISDNLVNETKALDLLEGVMSRISDDLYHPISVMRLFSVIVNRWQAEMESEEKKSLRKLVLRALKRVEKVPTSSQARFSNVPFVKKGLADAATKLIGI